MRSAELPSVTIVTHDGSNKTSIYQESLPGWQIKRREPSYDEERIQLMAPQTDKRPVFIAQEKAREDAPWVAAFCGIVEELASEGGTLISRNHDRIYLYTDTVQVVHNPDGKELVLEKPKWDPLTWATASSEAMAQSGKDVEIVSALSALRCTPDGISAPSTVIVRVKATMQPYTREDIVAFAKESGANTIPETAGGISLANGGRHFYDTGKPLVVELLDSLESKPVELMRFETWSDLPDSTLRPFICGALEPALTRVVAKTKASKMV